MKVYVTGIGMITPLGLDAKSTWSAMLKGKSGIATIQAFDAEGFETTIAGEQTAFDPTLYVDRKQARRLDRFAQFAVAATAQAMEQANLKLDDGSVDPTRVGSVIGSGIGGILTLSEQWGVLHDKGPDRVSPFLVPMMLADMAPGQVSIIHGAKGPNYCVVTACSSGADSIGIALDMIRRGDIDIALAGGTEAPICPIAVAGFNACKALSKRNDAPEAASRPFDADRDGFVMGEGAGVLVIESEESAERRGAVSHCRNSPAMAAPPTPITLRNPRPAARAPPARCGARWSRPAWRPTTSATSTPTAPARRSTTASRPPPSKPCSATKRTRSRSAPPSR